VSIYDTNTRINVQRGVAPDAYGDESDTTHVVATDVPASIRSLMIRTSDPSDGRVYTVITYRIRVPQTQDVQVGDRLITPDGSTYVVEQVAADIPSWDTGTFGKRIEARSATTQGIV
jgi:hypothetical protein